MSTRRIEARGARPLERLDAHLPQTRGDRRVIVWPLSSGRRCALPTCSPALLREDRATNERKARPDDQRRRGSYKSDHVRTIREAERQPREAIEPERIGRSGQPRFRSASSAPTLRSSSTRAAVCRAGSATCAAATLRSGGASFPPTASSSTAASGRGWTCSCAARRARSMLSGNHETGFVRFRTCSALLRAIRAGAGAGAGSGRAGTARTPRDGVR